jgi:serine/threonine protein phosphatase PrpC
MVTTMEESVAFDLSLLRCAAGTDVGMRRNENQDSFGIIKRDGFHGYFVADGMGGVHGGAVASRTVIASLEELLPRGGEPPSIASICSIVETINKRIFDKGSSIPNLAGMGTTLVGVVFTTSVVYSINVGDSRLYRVRGSQVDLLTEDHTLVRELVKSGAISEEEAEHHPVSHMLTRSLGPLATIEVDCRPLPAMPEPGDVFVLCSDGLYNLVSEQEILEVVRQNPLDDANQILINLANQRGGTDNITVVIIEVGHGPGRGRSDAFRQARDASSATVSANRDEPREQMNETKSSSHQEERTDSSGEQRQPPEAAQGPSQSTQHVREGRLTDVPEEEGAKGAPSASAGTSGLRRTDFHGPNPYGWPVRIMVASALCFGLVAGSFIRKTLFSSEEIEDGKGGVGLDDNGRTTFSATRESTSVTTGSPETRTQPGATSTVGKSYVVDNSLRPDLNTQVRLSIAERERMQKMRAWYVADIAKVEEQIGSLDDAGTRDVSEMLREARKKADLLQTSLAQIEEQRAATSIKLSVWYGRQKRLENESAIGLASEVGASSENVKEKKAALDRVTYEFIKIRDRYEENSGNSELAENVKRLTDERTRLMRELDEEVRKGIDAVLASTFKQLQDLVSERDMLTLQLQAVKQDLEFAKSVADPEQNQREMLREKLQQKLLGLRASLNDLDAKLEKDRGPAEPSVGESTRNAEGSQVPTSYPSAQGVVR